MERIIAVWLILLVLWVVFGKQRPPRAEKHEYQTVMRYDDCGRPAVVSYDNRDECSRGWTQGIEEDTEPPRSFRDNRSEGEKQRDFDAALVHARIGADRKEPRDNRPL